MYYNFDLLQQRVRNERARQGGVRDRSFWVHSLMAGEAPAPMRLHRQSHSSRPKADLFPITKLLIPDPTCYCPQFSSFFIVSVLFKHNVSFMHVGGPLFSSVKLRLSGILMGLYPFSFSRSLIYD